MPAPGSYTVTTSSTTASGGTVAPERTRTIGCARPRFCLPDRPSVRGETSENGWPTDPELVDRVIPGTRVVLRVRTGPAGELLAALALRFDRQIEGLDGPVPDDWGFDHREVRGDSTELSTHASGTAIDLNALCHPLGVAGDATFSPAELTALRGLVDSTRDVAVSGLSYGRVDVMHLALAPDTTDAQAQEALDALGGTAPPGIVALPSRPGCSS